MAHIRYFSLSICHSGSFIQQTHTHFQRCALISAAAFPFITTLSTFVGIWPVCFSCLTASSSRAQACLVPSPLLAQRGCLIAVLANEYVSLLSRNWPVPGWVQELILVPGLFFTSCGWGLRQVCTAGFLVTICCLTSLANQPSSRGLLHHGRWCCCPFRFCACVLAPGLFGLLCTTYSYHFSGFQVVS